MPAEIDTAVYANTPAWHREGIVLDTDGEKGLTIEVALPASGLDWEVEKVPAYALIDGKPVVIPGRYAVVRGDTKQVFRGAPGETWEPFQNHAGFKVVDDLIAQAHGEGHKTWIEAAGSLGQGEKVWVLAHIDTGLQIAGESYQEFILFTNGHDGRTSVTAATTNVRVVCKNTLTFALQGNPRVVRVRHTNRAADRIKEAAQILGMRNKYTEQLAIQGEFLAEQSVDEAQFEDFLKSLLPITADDTPAATMTKDRRSDIRKVYMGAPNLDPIRGTRWGVLQAVTEYSDYATGRKTDEAQLKAQWGINPTPIKDEAFTILKDPKMAPIKVDRKAIVA